MIHIRKANGTREPYKEDKVLSSIERAGIPPKEQLTVLSNISQSVYDDIPSSEVYSRVLDSLDKLNKPYAKTKYSLKQAIMMLGPTGYPFEDFVSQILVAQGYQTRVRQTLFGQCVSHEIDVIAEKNSKVSMIEAKFHNNAGARSEIHTALYTHARFQDVKDKHKFTDAWLVTNTKATTDAITYANCVGLKILSWSYPHDNGIREMIERLNLYPITLLTTLSSVQKMALLKKHVVMCSDVAKNPNILQDIILTHEEAKKVRDELDYVLSK